ncbi:MAG TPA: potassium channel family protein [Ktedonobacteraceae bacterium]|jgi:voltage-gated potassium channel|nr:potassium channel family protein [Ktedonobacteraceae bacterium]
MHVSASFDHLKVALILVFCVLAGGTSGYMLIEHLPFTDALYTTVTVMTTLGIVIHPLTEPGRILTMFVVIFGIGSLFYTLGVSMEFMLEGHFSQRIRVYLMDRGIGSLRAHAIICGFGRVGSQIAEDCATAGKPFVVIDEDEHNVEKCLQHNYFVLQGDATDDEILRAAGIQHAQCVLVATDNDAHNIFITLSARHLNGELFIVARANHTETEAKLKRAGADCVLSPYTIGGHCMAHLAMQAGGGEAGECFTARGTRKEEQL